MIRHNLDELDEHLAELLRVGVGGKFKTNSDYTNMVKEELEWEEKMLRGGIDRSKRNWNNALAKQQESTTLVGVLLLQKYVSLLSEQINNWVKIALSGQAGRHQIASKLICQCLESKHFEGKKLKDDNTSKWDNCSLIILKSCIDGISHRQTLNRLSVKIANSLEMESRITLFQTKDNPTFKKIAKRMASSKSIPMTENKYVYKKNVWVYYMNKANLEFAKWDKVERVHLGTKCIELASILGLVTCQTRKVARNKSIKYVEATSKLMNDIQKFNMSNEALHPEFMPMLMPPKEWSNFFDGGYYGKKYNKDNNLKEVSNALQSTKNKNKKHS